MILKAPNYFLNTGNPKWQMNLLFNVTFFQVLSVLYTHYMSRDEHYVYLHSSPSPDQYIICPIAEVLCVSQSRHLKTDRNWTRILSN